MVEDSPLKLVSGGTRFKAIGKLGGRRAHVQFSGAFEGEPVTWDTWLYTLEGWHETDEGRQSSRLRQFIDVGDTSGQMRDLTVCLAADAIDSKVVQMAMIMIRQYRLLRHGRHEFGQALDFDSAAD